MQSKWFTGSHYLVAWLVAISWVSALATTPSRCASSVSQCDQYNTCSGTNYDTTQCQVGIVRSGLATQQVSVLINGQMTSMNLFCVEGGTTVTWKVIDADATSFADVRFDSGNPFGQSSFGTDSTNFFAQKAVNSGSPTGGVCYVFSASDCKDVVQTANDCANSDPKVVVSNGGGYLKRKIKRLVHEQEHEHASPSQ
ncbi:MAG: hypothetical protein WAM65_14720 [Candidatus Korobacteraceae bacterium]